LDFNLTKKPGLILMVMEIFQCNYILSLALFFTTTLIREYIIQHQDMKDLLQQSYCNIALGSGAFILIIKIIEIGTTSYTISLAPLVIVLVPQPYNV
jgi:hypothetical protein